MATQKQKKLLAEIFCIFECLLTTNSTTRDSQLLILPDHMEDYCKIKTRGFRELFMTEDNFQTSSALNFPKKHRISEAWKSTVDMKFIPEFMCTCRSTYKLNII